MAKAQSIQPLHGGNKGHIKTLEDIRQHIDSKPALTVEDLKSWYSNKHDTTMKVSKPYMDSLFSAGLLATRGGRIRCTFPEGRHRDRRIVEIIDENVVYILEMLRDASDGKTEKQLHKLGKRCGLTGDPQNQIQKRRAWLQSAQFLERRDGKLYATPRGKELIRKHFGSKSVDDASNDGEEDPDLAVVDEVVQDAEFGGEAEGSNHRTLKEYVHNVAEKICGDDIEKCQMEYPLRSGDEVDVTAWNKRKIWHVEVKSRTSKDPDVTRGVYQCVKYTAVGKAMEKAKNSGRNVKCLLVVESKPSQNVSALADKLGVRILRLPASMRRGLDKLRETSG